MAAIEELNVIRTTAGENLCAMILADCAYNLQPLRGITQTYMYTNKSMPTRASYYVPRILQPLNDFLTKHSAHLAPDLKDSWSLCVASSMTDKYTHHPTHSHAHSH